MGKVNKSPNAQKLLDDLVEMMEGYDAILTEALELLEYATYHDGRYDQMARMDWQSKAGQCVDKLAATLGRKPYQGFGDRPAFERGTKA